MNGSHEDHGAAVARPPGSRSGRATAVLIALSLAACSEGERRAAPARPDEPLVAVHLAHLEPRPGTETVQFEGRSMYLDPAPIFSDPDLLGVEAYPGEGRLILDVQLDERAAERLERTARDNIGGSLALVFDSRVVSLPAIAAAVGATEMQIALPVYSIEEMERARRMVRERWPPR